MMRMSEYLVTGKETGARHPLHTADIEPLYDGVKTEWGQHVNGVSIFISGSKTDWLNEGATRSHSRVDENSPNKHICVVRALVALHSAFPAKFANKRDTPFACWRNGGAIPAPHVASIIRASIFKQGRASDSYSLHSLRAGGATALYRATRDIELVARFGRWRTASISAYLWESDQAMAGLSALMTQGGHTLHVSTKGLNTGGANSLQTNIPEGVGVTDKEGKLSNHMTGNWKRENRTDLETPKGAKKGKIRRLVI